MKGKHIFVNSNSRRSTKLRGGRPKPKKGNGGEMQRPKKNSAKCGCAHSGEWRQGLNACFDCGKSRNMVRDFLHNRGQAGGNAQPRTNSKGVAASEPPKMKKFYSLKGRQEQVKSAYVVTCMLQVFSTSAFALIDPGYMLSFVTPLLALTFEIFPEDLHDPIMVSTLLREM